MAKKHLSADEKQIDRARELLLANPIVKELGDIFARNRHELYIVGGSVRDALLGRVHDDFDFASDAAPEDIVELVNNYADELWKIGMPFGTIGLEKDGIKIEITTYRRELYDSNSSQPRVNFVASIETDLSRRDFTVNAMAFKLPTGEFLDLFGGLNDLANRELKTPLSPEESFNDDPLRMLRALRFVSTLVTDPSETVLSAITRLKARLKIVSAERIQAELSKLLVGLAPSQGLYFLATTGLADEFLPELSELAACYDPLHRHKDLLEHTLMVVENVPAELELRLAALLHDIGKPRTKSFGSDGIHFYHHEVLGAKMAKRRLRTLKYPTKTIDDVTTIIAMHMRFHTYSLGWADSAVRRYVRDCGLLLDKINQLVRADCTSRNPSQSRKFALLLDELDQRIADLERQEESAKIRAPLNGHEVMEYLHLTPGPQVGEVMKALLEARLEEKILTKESAYKFIEKWLKDDKVV